MNLTINNLTNRHFTLILNDKKIDLEPYAVLNLSFYKPRKVHVIYKKFFVSSQKEVNPEQKYGIINIKPYHINIWKLLLNIFCLGFAFFIMKKYNYWVTIAWLLTCVYSFYKSIFIDNIIEIKE